MKSIQNSWLVTTAATLDFDLQEVFEAILLQNTKAFFLSCG